MRLDKIKLLRKRKNVQKQQEYRLTRPSRKKYMATFFNADYMSWGR